MPRVNKKALKEGGVKSVDRKIYAVKATNGDQAHPSSRKAVFFPVTHLEEYPFREVSNSEARTAVRSEYPLEVYCEHNDKAAAIWTVIGDGVPGSLRIEGRKVIWQESPLMVQSGQKRIEGQVPSLNVITFPLNEHTQIHVREVEDRFIFRLRLGKTIKLDNGEETIEFHNRAIILWNNEKSVDAFERLLAVRSLEIMSAEYDDEAKCLKKTKPVLAEGTPLVDFDDKLDLEAAPTKKRRAQDEAEDEDAPRKIPRKAVATTKAPPQASDPGEINNEVPQAGVPEKGEPSGKIPKDNKEEEDEDKPPAGMSEKAAHAWRARARIQRREREEEKKREKEEEREEEEKRKAGLRAEAKLKQDLKKAAATANAQPADEEAPTHDEGEEEAGTSAEATTTEEDVVSSEPAEEGEEEPAPAEKTIPAVATTSDDAEAGAEEEEEEEEGGDEEEGASSPASVEEVKSE